MPTDQTRYFIILIRFQQIYDPYINQKLQPFGSCRTGNADACASRLTERTLQMFTAQAGEKIAEFRKVFDLFTLLHLIHQPFVKVMPKTFCFIFL